MTQFSNPRANRGRRRAGAAIFLIAGIALFLLLFQNLWLPWIGEWLVTSDTPAPADLIVVLGGEFWGPRVIKAADLAVQGYAPHVMISGPDYGLNGVVRPEGDWATQFAVEKGYPRSLFWTFSHHAASTIGEAKVLVPELKRMNVKRVLIVTSEYHSRRASLIFHAMLPFAEVRVIGAQNEYFQPQTWWKADISRRLVRSEWMKIMGTIAYGWVLRLQAG